MCPQVLQAGASPCIDLLAALTASKLAVGCAAVADLWVSGVLVPTTLISLNSGVRSPMVGVLSSHGSSPVFSMVGLSNT
jgi:hypothetical protein